MKVNLKLGDTQLILEYCETQRLTLEQTAYVMATAYWETNRTVKPVQEAYWLSDGWRRRNLRYYPWHGRGYVQITWEANYVKAGKKLGLDLTTDPDVVMDPKVAVQILVRGSMEGWFTGKKLSDYVNPVSIDYRSARRVINGTDKAFAIANIANSYAAALREAGYGKKGQLK